MFKSPFPAAALLLERSGKTFSYALMVSTLSQRIGMPALPDNVRSSKLKANTSK
jgi:hypothetical protein